MGSTGGTREVDGSLVEEIEGWRLHVATAIAARRPGVDERELGLLTQRTMERVLLLRSCESRGVEPFGLLQAIDGKDGVPEVDARTIEDVASRLHPPRVPGESSVLPPDILGRVYERSLGKRIRLTPARRVRVELDPELRNRGGSFYTPTFIVDYLVREVLGPLCIGRAPGELAGLRVLDPACGAGAFLIAAYQFLLDWYRDWYTSNSPERHARGRSPVIYEGPDGHWRLTSAERQRILLAHIFGIDSDPHAVAVTRLSLLLKLFEGERSLPALGDNIKCGNSLIGGDVCDGLSGEQADEVRRRLNPFDWARELGGIPHQQFDAILGNPPYIPMERLSAVERGYFPRRYPELARKYDTSVIFTLAMLERLGPRGRLGFISSTSWQTGANHVGLRRRLFTTAGLESLVNLPYDIFPDAFVDTGIFIVTRAPRREYRIYNFPKKRSVRELAAIPFRTVRRSLVEPGEYKVVLDPVAVGIFRRMSAVPGARPLGDLTRSTQGKHGAALEPSPRRRGRAWLPFLKEGGVQRYLLAKKSLHYVSLAAAPSLRPFYEAGRRLLIRRVISRQDRLLATYAEEALVTTKDINPFVITEPGLDAAYLLALVNSRLFSYVYVNTSAVAVRDDFRQTTLAELRRLPIIPFDASLETHREIAASARQLLELRREAEDARAEHERTSLARRFEGVDTRLDQAVNALYGLSEEESTAVMTWATAGSARA